MHITNAKSKLLIVRRRRATYAIVMAVINWKRLRRSRPLYRRSFGGQVEGCRRCSLYALTTREGKEQRVYRPSLALSRAMLPLYIRTRGITLEGAGVAPRRATMPACTDARMCRVLHAFFTSLHTHACTHACTHARTQPYVRTATFPLCTGVYPSCVLGEDASYFTLS